MSNNYNAQSAIPTRDAVNNTTVKAWRDTPYNKNGVMVPRDANKRGWKQFAKEHKHLGYSLDSEADHNDLIARAPEHFREPRIAGAPVAAKADALVLTDDERLIVLSLRGIPEDEHEQLTAPIKQRYGVLKAAERREALLRELEVVSPEEYALLRKAEAKVKTHKAA